MFAAIYVLSTTFFRLPSLPFPINHHQHRFGDTQRAILSVSSSSDRDDKAAVMHSSAKIDVFPIFTYHHIARPDHHFWVWPFTMCMEIIPIEVKLYKSLTYSSQLWAAVLLLCQVWYNWPPLTGQFYCTIRINLNLNLSLHGLFGRICLHGQIKLRDRELGISSIFNHGFRHESHFHLFRNASILRCRIKYVQRANEQLPIISLGLWKNAGKLAIIYFYWI